jgi:two-component system, LytTR family, sensor kinase
MTERFRGKLSFEVHVAPGLGKLLVPRLLLQPLVENALRHGLSSGHGSLCVDVVHAQSHLYYAISDDGVGLKEGGPKVGTGLSNVERRLELLYPGTHTFTLSARQPRGTVARLSFPVVT